MSKKILTLIILTFFLNFIFSCTTTSTLTREEVVKTSSTSEIKAKKLQEIQLITKGEIHTGKLLSLEGGDLILLPFPYWNVEPIKIDLNEIDSIKVRKKHSRAGERVAGSFAWGFIITGILTGLSSEYDVDFEAALLYSAIIGAFSGLLGLFIGGVGDVTKILKYDFYKMSDSEKIRVINKIMGV
jgi:hypothetical protein